jgi:hypothetical protein
MDSRTLQSVVLAVGIALGGLLGGMGFARGREADRFVTVKGVTEREARADLAIWPLHLVGTDNDLTAAHAKLQRSITGVRQFLQRHGIDTTQAELTGFSVSDASTNQFAGAGAERGSRFVIRQTLIVRSSKPEEVLAASQKIGELAAVGVVISSGSGGEFGGSGSGPTFVFTGLNKLKPPMIAESTQRAREAAEQFARDSRTELGGIRHASQGIFEILPRDQAQGITEESQIAKIVRVVTTVEYFLK